VELYSLFPSREAIQSIFETEYGHKDNEEIDPEAGTADEAEPFFGAQNP
jgi:hypothetical protein